MFLWHSVANAVGQRPQQAQGRYFWELLFSLDNRNNDKSVMTRKVSRERVTEVHSRVFLSEKFSIGAGFKYKNETNASLKFRGVGIKNTNELSYHIETAMDLEETSETTKNTKETEYFEEIVDVQPGDSIVGYRLCYVTNGILIKTDVVALMSAGAEPPEDILVDLDFSVTERILGFREVADRLLHARPRRDNKEELAAIRRVSQHPQRGGALLVKPASSGSGPSRPPPKGSPPRGPWSPVFDSPPDAGDRPLSTGGRPLIPVPSSTQTHESPT